ncbi:MAG: transcription antitermination factor NusB [Candidatus Aminicenantes bacterium]|jgi:N utilization substance protein B|nr:transcription antitermination factor NusB [Candidatus Aminicenantes bacterium]
MGKRRKARECALQILFQLEFGSESLEEVLRDFWQHQKVASEVKDYGEYLVRGINQHKQEIDDIIQQASKNWRLERMAVVDRNVLRIAVYEMMIEKNLASPIIINEAIEIARKFSGQEAAIFINGLLDSINRRLRPEAQKREKAQLKNSDKSGEKEVEK